MLVASSWCYLLCLGAVAATMLPTAARTASTPQEEAPLVKIAEYHMKFSRQGAATAVLGENIYIFGGSAFGAVAQVERFNTRTSRLDQPAIQLLPRRWHTVLEHGGKFHLFGGEGYGLPGNPLEHAVEIYDPATGQVSRGSAMPLPRSSMAAVKLGHRAYFSGGSRLKGHNRAQTNETEIFDFSTGKWSVGVPMPTPRETQAAVVSDFILVLGGYRNKIAVSNVEMFVPQENIWKSLPPLDRPISAHSLAFLGEYLFLFGDYYDLDSVVAYNLRTRKSLNIKPGFKGARHTSAIVSGDRIYVIGGTLPSETGNELDLIQVFSINPDYSAK